MLLEIRDALRKFNDARDWDQFHSPKNLAIALMVEAAEVGEHFRWMTEEVSRSLPDVTRKIIGDELADVLIFLVILADKLHIDLEQAACSKLNENGRKYPIEKARGSAAKYTELGSGAVR